MTINTMTRPPELRELFGLRFWDASLDDVADFLVRCAVTGERFRGFFVNAHCVNVAARDETYAKLLGETPYLFADGVGMSIAARLHGLRLRHNVNGTDLFPRLCAVAARAGVPIALLGARPGVAATCAQRMEEQLPGLRVAWTGHGYLTAGEEALHLRHLNASGARILLVAKGVPMQEHWIARHGNRVDAPVLLGVGALLDFYSGMVPRAPQLVRRLQAEWVYRLLQEPRRLSGRYLLGNPAFLARTLRWRASGGGLRSAGARR
jgi:N-acetylglucosaminyldiphosphoundecaprenol N-acetyl-beta-D-mannosaminyltransferase